MKEYEFYTDEVKKEELTDTLNNIASTGGIIHSIIPNRYAKTNDYNYAGQQLESVLVVYKLRTVESLMKENNALKTAASLNG